MRILAANWKMNPETVDEALRLASRIDTLLKDLPLVKLLFPPYVYIPLLKLENLTLGAQDVFYEPKGAFTGEISPTMLRDLGVGWVIVGHSERRNVIGEVDEVLRKKAEASLRYGLNVVYCVGERLEERERGEHFSVVERQLSFVPRDERVVIAYEPVWAIGTGRNATPEQIEEMHAFIKDRVGLKVLYGGSVKEKNAGELAAVEGVDGFLVGGASLRPEEFYRIGVALSR